MIVAALVIGGELCVGHRRIGRIFFGGGPSVSAASAEVKLQSPQGVAEESYTTTYFPGTTDPPRISRDQPATRTPGGGERAAAASRASKWHRSRIVMIALEPAGERLGTVRSNLIRSPDGVFELAGVLPGKYVLSAQAPDMSKNGVGAAAARRVVEVDQADLEGIQLTLAAPQKVTGAVVASRRASCPVARRSDARGLCTLRGVTPGDYHGFAFAKDVNVDFRDPESTTDAEPVKVTEGSDQSFALEVSPEDP